MARGAVPPPPTPTAPDRILHAHMHPPTTIYFPLHIKDNTHDEETPLFLAVLKPYQTTPHSLTALLPFTGAYTLLRRQSSPILTPRHNRPTHSTARHFSTVCYFLFHKHKRQQQHSNLSLWFHSWLTHSLLLQHGWISEAKKIQKKKQTYHTRKEMSTTAVG